MPTPNVEIESCPDYRSRPLPKSLYYATSGHKNVQSITSYFNVSQKQQLNMSHTLTGLSLGEIAPKSPSSIPEKRKHEFDELAYPTSKQAAQQPLTLFSGAVMSGGHIRVAITL